MAKCAFCPNIVQPGGGIIVRVPRPGGGQTETRCCNECARKGAVYAGKLLRKQLEKWSPMLARVLRGVAQISKETR